MIAIWNYEGMSHSNNGSPSTNDSGNNGPGVENPPRYPGPDPPELVRPVPMPQTIDTNVVLEFVTRLQRENTNQFLTGIQYMTAQLLQGLHTGAATDVNSGLNSRGFNLSLPEYEGTTPPLDWVRRIDLVFETKRTNDWDRVMYARTALTGIARQHAELYIQYPCTWKEFATNLIERFTVRGLEIRTRQQLYDLKMQGRDVLKYITEFQTLLGTVTVSDESERIFLFVHGLDTRTQQEVMYKNPRTLKDATDIACAYLNAHVPLSASVNVPTSSTTSMEMDTLVTEDVNVVQSRRSPSRTFSRSRRRFSRSPRKFHNYQDNAFKRFSYSSTHRSRSPMKRRRHHCDVTNVEVKIIYNEIVLTFVVVDTLIVRMVKTVHETTIVIDLRPTVVYMFYLLVEEVILVFHLELQVLTQELQLKVVY